jgi:hypothetical protein
MPFSILFRRSLRKTTNVEVVEALLAIPILDLEAVE